MRILIEKNGYALKNSVVLDHWHENAKVTAIKQQKSKKKVNEKVQRKQLSSCTIIFPEYESNKVVPFKSHCLKCPVNWLMKIC
jgi:hypothetical protein